VNFGHATFLGKQIRRGKYERIVTQTTNRITAEGIAPGDVDLSNDDFFAADAVQRQKEKSAL
jgi:hypothetical protein